MQVWRVRLRFSCCAIETGSDIEICDEETARTILKEHEKDMDEAVRRKQGTDGANKSRVDKSA